MLRRSIQSYAWLGKVAEAARSFTIPMWDFSTYAGISFVGELQQGPLYPPSWILGILGFSKMPLVDAFLVLHFVLAAGLCICFCAPSASLSFQLLLAV